MTAPWAAAVVLVALGSPGEVGRARKLFEVGARAYQNQNYPVAISAFEAAYKLARPEQVVFSLAQAHRLQFMRDSDPWKVKRALDLYREYLSRFPSGKRRRFARQHRNTLRPILVELRAKRPGAFVRRDVTPSTQFVLSSQISGAKVIIGREEVTEFPDTLEVDPGEYEVRFEAPGYFSRKSVMRMPAGATVPLDVDLTPKPAQVRLHAPDGSDVSIDGIFHGKTPLLRPIELNAGRHLLAVVKNGAHAYAKELELRRGQTVELTATLRGTSQRTTSYVLMAAGGALAVGSGVAFGFAQSAYAEARALDAKRKSQGLTERERNAYHDAKNARSRANSFGFAIAGVAVATGVAAVLLYALDLPRAPLVADAVVTAGPALAGGVGGVAVAGSF